MRKPSYTTLAIKVTPRTAHDLVVGWCSIEQKEIAVRVRAAAADGKANVALIALIARELGIPKGSVRILRGETSRHKLLELKIEPDRLDSWLKNLPLSGLPQQTDE